MAFLVDSFKHESAILQLVQDSVTTREYVVYKAFKLFNVDLLDLHGPPLELLYQVPMQEGETLINNVSVELIVIIHIQVIDCEELCVKLIPLSLFHQLSSLVALVFSFQAFEDILELYQRLIVIVVVLCAPVWHIHRNRVVVHLLESFDKKDALEAL